MIPRGSTSFCLYDTRSLSDDSDENIKMLKHWMTRGVRHGELVTRSKHRLRLCLFHLRSGFFLFYFFSLQIFYFVWVSTYQGFR